MVVSPELFLDSFGLIDKYGAHPFMLFKVKVLTVVEKVGYLVAVVWLYFDEFGERLFGRDLGGRIHDSMCKRICVPRGKIEVVLVAGQTGGYVCHGG